MAVHWTISFKSLRAQTVYTASVYDSSYSGTAIPLIPGDEPFTTEEDNDDDPFKPLRTQTGYLRIVDNGKDANGNAFDWTDLQPKTDYDRPVVLTNAGGTVVWQGFLQAQNFSGELYEPTQEREFPIQCALSMLASQYPSTTYIGIVNFAYLLNTVSSALSTVSGSVITFDSFVIQGGVDARNWLLKKFHWANLMKEDSDEDVTPQYDLKTCLEDMCKFWGWTARTYRKTLYLMCPDDAAEQTLLTLTPAQLATMAGGTGDGTLSNNPFVRQNLTGDIFASDDNEVLWMNGPSKVTVNADCNKQSDIVEFAPKPIRKQMEDAGSYSWVAGAEEATGYYTTPLIRSVDSAILSGSATSEGGFCRRQIYSRSDQAKSTNLDMIVVNNASAVSPVVSLQTKRMISFVSGSLKFSGYVYMNEVPWDSDGEDDYLKVRIGVGLDRSSAKWFHIECDNDGNITYGWDTNVRETKLTIGTGDIKGVGFSLVVLAIPFLTTLDAIPTNGNMYGYVFVDFLGSYYDVTQQGYPYQVGNFGIEFSREETFIPSNVANSPRKRSYFIDRQSSYEYTADIDKSKNNQEDIDLVYASDKDMEYGFGLLMNTDYSYMATVYYGESLQHPEQHLANRIAAYWGSAKQMVSAELRTDVVESSSNIDPQKHLVLDGVHYRTLAINHQWRDDVTSVKMIESLIEI